MKINLRHVKDFLKSTNTTLPSKKNLFTNEGTGKSWIKFMNEDNDELPPYNFVV